MERFAAERFPDAVWLFCDRRHSATPLHPLRPALPELFEAGGEPTTRSILAALQRRWDAARPALVVEDVDAADPSTLDLLEALPDHLPRGLVLMTTRSAAAYEIAGDVVARIALGPLDRASSRTLAAGMAGGRRLRLDTLNEIADRSGGVPLHVQALTHAVLDSGVGATAVPTSLYDSLRPRSTASARPARSPSASPCSGRRSTPPRSPTSPVDLRWRPTSRRWWPPTCCAVTATASASPARWWPRRHTSRC